jgi:hypothetical protein
MYFITYDKIVVNIYITWGSKYALHVWAFRYQQAGVEDILNVRFYTLIRLYCLYGMDQYLQTWINRELGVKNLTRLEFTMNIIDKNNKIEKKIYTINYLPSYVGLYFQDAQVVMCSYEAICWGAFLTNVKENAE